MYNIPFLNLLRYVSLYEKCLDHISYHITCPPSHAPITIIICLMSLKTTFIAIYYLVSCSRIIVRSGAMSCIGRELYFSDITADLRAELYIASGNMVARPDSLVFSRGTPPVAVDTTRCDREIYRVSNRKRVSLLNSRWRITYAVRFITQLSWWIERNYQATSIPPPRVCNPLGAISHSSQRFSDEFILFFYVGKLFKALLITFFLGGFSILYLNSSNMGISNIV